MMPVLSAGGTKRRSSGFQTSEVVQNGPNSSTGGDPSHFDAVSPTGAAAVDYENRQFAAVSPTAAQAAAPSSLYGADRNPSAATQPGVMPPPGRNPSNADHEPLPVSTKGGAAIKVGQVEGSSAKSTYQDLVDADGEITPMAGGEAPFNRFDSTRGSIARSQILMGAVGSLPPSAVPTPRHPLGNVNSPSSTGSPSMDPGGDCSPPPLSENGNDGIPGRRLVVRTQVAPSPQHKGTFLGGAMATGDKNQHHVMQARMSTRDTYVAENQPLACNMCGDQVFEEESGFVPCECAFRLCATCLEHVQKYENNRCPGCLNPMKSKEAWLAMQEFYDGEEEEKGLGKGTKNGLAPTGSFHKALATVDVKAEMVPLNLADYGYGSAGWEAPPNKAPERAIPQVDLKVKGLFRTLHIDGSKLGPYRIFVGIRLLALAGFLHYRITTPTDTGYWLWLMSVIAEVWFAVSWLLDVIPKLTPVDRETFPDRLRAVYDEGGEKLPPVDVFITTADASKEPPLISAQTILSVLAMDYPANTLACYLSDDGSSKVMFDVMAETAGFARLWVPFCKKFEIEPRNPEIYFSQTIDFTANKVQPDFVKSRRRVKREYEEFKVRINALCHAARSPPPDGWKMKDGSPWPGNNRRNHDGIVQVFLHPDGDVRDVEGNHLPPLIYVSREKRPGHEHHKKAGAMNALVRASGLITNGQFLLNLDCDHYVNNAQSVREALCFFLDPIKGRDVGYVQFPQRFDGVDRNDRYANHNTVFFDVNMKGLDGQQGPVYVGTGCMFRRKALYGFYPPPSPHDSASDGFFSIVCCCCGGAPKEKGQKKRKNKKKQPKREGVVSPDDAAARDEESAGLITQGKENRVRLGMCEHFVQSAVDGDDGQPLSPRSMLSDVILAISCDYEENTDWGDKIGWMYGSITEDILTGLRIHSRGWRSIYCNPDRAAFKGSAPLNMTDRLVQVLRWATGAVEIFFSKRNTMISMWNTKLQLRQRLAYANNSFYPFTSIAILTYCCLPPLSLLTNYFFVPALDRIAIIWFATLIVSFLVTSILELRWSRVTFEAWWRNEQFWVVAGISAHFFAVIQGLLKVLAGLELNFTLTAKGGGEGEDFDELHTFKYSNLLLVPLFIGLFNVVGVIVGVAKVLTSSTGGSSSSNTWGKLLGKLCFAGWVILHLIPFFKGMLGRRDKLPTIMIVWSVLIVITVSMLYSNFFG